MWWAFVSTAVVFLVATVAMSLVCLRIVTDLIMTLNRERARHTQQIDALTDKVVASSYAEYKGWQTPPPEPTGGEEEEDTVVFNLPEMADTAAERPWSDAALKLEEGEAEAYENRRG